MDPLCTVNFVNGQYRGLPVKYREGCRRCTRVLEYSPTQQESRTTGKAHTGYLGPQLFYIAKSHGAPRLPTVVRVRYWLVIRTTIPSLSTYISATIARFHLPAARPRQKIIEAKLHITGPALPFALKALFLLVDTLKLAGRGPPQKAQRSQWSDGAPMHKPKLEARNLITQQPCSRQR